MNDLAYTFVLMSPLFQCYRYKIIYFLFLKLMKCDCLEYYSNELLNFCIL